MKLLKTELAITLEELAIDKPKDKEPQEKPMNTEQILKLFDKLEPMLKNINPDCAGLLDDIRAVPGATELALQIEDFDFESATETLAALKKGFLAAID